MFEKVLHMQVVAAQDYAGKEGSDQGTLKSLNFVPGK